MGKIEVKERKQCNLAYIEHFGPYDAIPFEKYFPQLYGYAKEEKVRPGFTPLGIYFSNPLNTFPTNCRSEIAITIIGKAKPRGKIRIKDLPAMTVAVIKHKDTADKFDETYKELTNWISENEYEQIGPMIEIYTKKPKTVGKETIIYAHIQAPVKKK
ncbi:MAG TPA: GyrI-like domain-containing protein [Nitrososphaerales archaeon]